MSSGGWLKEARRRRVFRTAGVYIVGAWVVVQIALAIFPALSIDESAIRYVWIAALLGFPFALLFGWRYDLKEGSIVRTLPGESDASLGLERADYVILAAIALIALAILAGSVREIGDMEPIQDVMEAPADVDPATVAVLPFANMSADPENEYFSDGLTETLLHMLAQLDDLKVAARTSSFAFKGVNDDIRTIADELDVAHVLEGSVQKAGSRVRVTAQLIRAEDGFHLWSQNYDRELDDIFAIQDEIAGDVASALGSSLLDEPGRGIRGIETQDFTAYDLFLQALEQQNINSKPALDEAERLFQAALDKDPTFVDAKLGLARNYVWKRWKEFETGGAHFDSALALLQELREDAPDNVDAQVMKLLVQIYQARESPTRWGQDPVVGALIDEALVIAREQRIDSFLTSNLVNLISGFPWYRDEIALELLSRALEDDPLNFELLWAQSVAYIVADRPEDARQPLLTALKLAPENPRIPRMLGNLAMRQDRYPEGFEWLRKAWELDVDDREPLRDITMALYDLELFQQGDYWQAKALDPDENSCTNDAMRVIELDAKGAHEPLIEMLSEGLQQAADNFDFCYFPEERYIWTMAEEGRIGEALEYLGSLDPRVLDFDQLIEDNIKLWIWQAMALWASAAVMEPEVFRQTYERYMEDVFAVYPDYFDIAAPNYTISHYVFAEQPEEARRVFFETFAAWPTYGPGLHWRWHQLLNYPWLAEFRSDPEIAAVIDRYHQYRANMRADVAEFLEQPAWQDGSLP